ncbi:hypothetical protein [Geobacillus zalihae]|uniref:hypothetical protein n=1 Tax=Geobacillus zalihae TaxID=213419 RepID=UPI0007644582|nr:hypothetical protein [Geobacillus zalihae]
MKKMLYLLAFSFMFLMFNHETSAAEYKKNYYPTKTEIEALNQELQELVDEANERLSNGEKNIELTSKNLKLVFKENNSLGSENIMTNQLNTMGVNASSIGSKSYQAYVTNTAGFNFTHAVSGIFSWNGDYLTGVSADADLTGIMYDKSSNTTVTGLDGTIGRDAKIARVTSKGTFKALKYFVTYHTTLMVDVYAPTKSYRIVEAKITY